MTFYPDISNESLNIVTNRLFNLPSLGKPHPLAIANPVGISKTSLTNSGFKWVSVARQFPSWNLETVDARDFQDLIEACRLLGDSQQFILECHRLYYVDAHAAAMISHKLKDMLARFQNSSKMSLRDSAFIVVLRSVVS